MAQLKDDEIISGFAAAIQKLREQAQKANEPILEKARLANPKKADEKDEEYQKRINELTKKDRRLVPAALPKEQDRFQPRTRDFVTISKFLQTDNQLMLKALQKLEAAMAQELDKRGQNSSGTYKRTDFTPGRDANHINRHLLTTVLGANEIAEGFSHVVDSGGRVRAPAIYGNIGDAFGPLITQGVLAKDYIGGQHGLYTHRIQWYCVSVMKTDLKLENQKIGDLQKISGIYWNRVFDLPAEDAVDKSDCRRPENLATYLTTDFWAQKNLPLLSGFLQSRNTKGSQQLQGAHYKLLYAKNKLRNEYPDLANKLKGVYNLSTAQANKLWTELKGQTLSNLKLTKELEEIDAVFKPNQGLSSRVLDETGKVLGATA